MDFMVGNYGFLGNGSSLIWCWQCLGIMQVEQIEALTKERHEFERKCLKAERQIGQCKYAVAGLTHITSRTGSSP